MNKKFHFYFLAALMLFVAAGVIYYFGSNTKEEETTANKLHDIDNALNITGKVEGAESSIFDDKLLPEDASAEANRYIISAGKISYSVDKKFIQKPESKVIGTNERIKGLGWYDSQLKTAAMYAESNMKDFKTDSQKRDQDVLGIFSDFNIQITGVFSNIELSNSQTTKVKTPLSISINGIQKDVPFDIDIDLKDENLMAKGSATILMSDFGLNPPSLLNVFTVSDKTDISFEIAGQNIKNK